MKRGKKWSFNMIELAVAIRMIVIVLTFPSEVI